MMFARGNKQARKLNAELVREMRQHYAEGATQGQLGKYYGVSVVQVGRIVRGESWSEGAGDREQTPAEKDATIARLLATQAAVNAVGPREQPPVIARVLSPLEGGEAVSETDGRALERARELARHLGLDIEAARTKP